MKAARQMSARRLLQGLSGATMALVLVSGAALAQDNGERPGGNGTMFGGGSSGGIGTIPSTHAGGPGLPEPGSGLIVSGSASGLAPMAELKPALRLVGSTADLDAVIASTYSPDGSGWFQLTPLKAKERMSIEFYGNVVVELDREAFRQSGVLVQLDVGPSFAGGVAVLQSPGGERAAQVLATGPLNLKLHRTVESGLADDGLQLLARSTAGERASLTVTGLARTIRLQQRH
jgi:hypothetical protein